MIVIVMGVAGAGKTTVGRTLAEALGWPFYDGDDFHPPANVAKMAAGIPLTDADRTPWLDILHRLIEDALQQNVSAVLACSALKQSYRNLLAGGNPAVRYVYLRITPELARERLRQRRGHYMPAALIDSQFAALEEPVDAVMVDASLPVEDLVGEIREGLGF